MAALPRQHCQDGKTALPRPCEDGAADTVLPRHKVDANIGPHFNNEQMRDYEAIAKDIAAMK